MSGRVSQKIAVFLATLILVVSLIAHQPLETALLRAFVTWIISSMILFVFAILMSRLAVSALKTEHSRRTQAYIDWQEEQRKREEELARTSEAEVTQ
ncbi:MAG: hypothetical protein OEM52_02340 [bacterium]|nr:hypothetical protein [bacterium]